MTEICPSICQQFDSLLLSYPYSKCKDSSEDLWRIYQYLKKRTDWKVRNLPEKKKKCENILREFLEIYEQIQKKEKELEGKTEHHTQRPFYFFRSIGAKGESAFRISQWRSRSL